MSRRMLLGCQIGVLQESKTRPRATQNPPEAIEEFAAGLNEERGQPSA